MGKQRIINQCEGTSSWSSCSFTPWCGSSILWGWRPAGGIIDRRETSGPTKPRTRWKSPLPAGMRAYADLTYFKWSCHIPGFQQICWWIQCFFLATETLAKTMEKHWSCTKQDYVLSDPKPDPVDQFRLSLMFTLRIKHSLLNSIILYLYSFVMQKIEKHKHFSWFLSHREGSWLWLWLLTLRGNQIHKGECIWLRLSPCCSGRGSSPTRGPLLHVSCHLSPCLSSLLFLWIKLKNPRK